MKIWGLAANRNDEVVVINESDEAVADFQRKHAAELRAEILNQVSSEDARNDVPVIEKEQKTRKKKLETSITFGRNKNKIGNETPRDLPTQIEPRHGPSNTLSRLLFSKQNMERRDQMKVVYRQFGPDAEDILVVESDEGMPSPDEANHVVVKVQVRKCKR